MAATALWARSSPEWQRIWKVLPLLQALILKNDKRKILIHEDFAKENNLKLNDVLSLELIEWRTMSKKKNAI